MANTKLTNVSGGALTLPPPYGGVIAFGKSVTIGDTRANVLAALGIDVGNAAVLADDTEDAATPGYSAPHSVPASSVTGTFSGVTVPAADVSGALSAATIAATAVTGGANIPTTTVNVTSSPATLTKAQGVALVNNAAATTVNLPITPVAGETHRVKDSGGNAATDTITVKTTDGSTIDGGSGSTGVALASTAYSHLTFVSDGTNWFTI